MNVGFAEYSTADVARMLHLDITTVSGWCRQGMINFVDMSDGDKKARYMIPEDEVNYIRQLFKNHGKAKAMRHYNKKRLEPKVIEKKEEEFVQTYPWLLDNDGVEEDKEQYPTVKAEPAKVIEMSIDETPTKKKIDFDEDKLLNSVLHIREVKEEIENCKARLAQLENEYKEYKQEIMEWL